MSEHSEQVALMEWASTRQGTMPELAYLFSVPNGGQRTRWERGQKLAEGLKSGVPDLMLPVARQGKHGLWIEMKSDSGAVTANQDRWLAFLRTQGYATEVCYGWQSAANIIESYLGVPMSERTEFFS